MGLDISGKIYLWTIFLDYFLILAPKMGQKGPKNIFIKFLCVYVPFRSFGKCFGFFDNFLILVLKIGLKWAETGSKWPKKYFFQIFICLCIISDFW